VEISEHGARSERLAGRLNLVPVALMSLVYLAPLLLFWGAAFGPLRPDGFPPVPTWMSLAGALVCTVAGWLATRVGERYYVLRAFEDHGRLYSRFGIRWVRRFITNGDVINQFVRARHPGYRPSGGRGGLVAFEAGTRTAEVGHLMFFVAGSATAAFAAAIGVPGWAGVISVGNVIANVLPILLQRYNRGRVSRILNRDAEPGNSLRSRPSG